MMPCSGLCLKSDLLLLLYIFLHFIMISFGRFNTMSILVHQFVLMQKGFGQNLMNLPFSDGGLSSKVIQYGLYGY